MWLISGTITRRLLPASARSANWLASVPDGMKTAVSLPSNSAQWRSKPRLPAEQVVVLADVPRLGKPIEERGIGTRREGDAVAR